METVKYRGTLPKDKFPRQLKLSLNRLPNASDNLIAGFAATGNAEKVLEYVKETGPQIFEANEKV